MAAQGAAAAAFVRSADEAHAAEQSRVSVSEEPRRDGSIRRNGSAITTLTAASEAWAANLLHAEAGRGGSAHGESGASELGHPPALAPGRGRDAAWLESPTTTPWVSPATQHGSTPLHGHASALAAAPVPSSWTPDGLERSGGSGAAAAAQKPGAPSEAAQRGFVNAAVHIARMVSCPCRCRLRVVLALRGRRGCPSRGR